MKVKHRQRGNEGVHDNDLCSKLYVLQGGACGKPLKQFDQLGLWQIRRQIRQLEDGESRGEEGGEEGAGVLVVQPCHHLGQDGVGHGGGEQGGRHLQPADPQLLTWKQIASSSFNIASLHEKSNQALSGQDEERLRLDPGRHFGSWLPDPVWGKPWLTLIF